MTTAPNLATSVMQVVSRWTSTIALERDAVVLTSDPGDLARWGVANDKITSPDDRNGATWNDAVPTSSVIRTLFRPQDGMAYWLKQVGP